MPVSIDQALEGVTMKWNVGSTCSSCVTSNVKWTDGQNNNAGSTAYWDVDDGPPYGDRWGRVATTWNGTGKETIGLGWSVTATVDASSTAIATANFGTSGIDEVKELAPRCDDFVGGSAPGCVLPYFKPTWTVDPTCTRPLGGVRLVHAAGGARSRWLEAVGLADALPGPGHPGEERRRQSVDVEKQP